MNQLLDEFSGVLGRTATDAARARLHELARQANQTMDFCAPRPHLVILDILSDYLKRRPRRWASAGRLSKAI